MGNYSTQDEHNDYNRLTMGEVINHICGTCGENHPSMITLPALLVAIAGYFTYIKCKIKSLWKRN